MLYITNIPVHQNIMTVWPILVSTGIDLWDILFREETTELDNCYKPTQDYRIVEFKKTPLNICKYHDISSKCLKTL